MLPTRFSAKHPLTVSLEAAGEGNLPSPSRRSSWGCSP